MRDEAPAIEGLRRELERAEGGLDDLVASDPAVARATRGAKLAGLGQVVLVLQGGGALGAYQVGAYEALQEAGIEPDWVIGTSIGAINGALIAGNAPEQRLPRLRAFWSRMEPAPWLAPFAAWPFFGPALANAATLGQGLPAFFRPNLSAFASPHAPLGPEAAGFYDTAPLRETLSELVDVSRLDGSETRLTVGAANARTGAMRYFDSREGPLDLRHVMASGALPPAFPAVRIDGDLYWDGGILSNTPVEAVFDDNPRRDSIVFAVHVWSPNGPDPATIWQVASRQKDIQYASRAVSHIARQKQIHRLRHAIAELGRRLPDSERLDPEVREALGYGCLTRMHVVRLLAPPVEGEDHTKDIDFSRGGIERRREAGRADMARVLAAEPWRGEFDPMEGMILHEARPGALAAAA